MGWRSPGLARRGYGRGRGPGTHRQRAMTVLKAMVLVSTENQTAASSPSAGTGRAGGASVREGLWGKRWVRRHSSPHHVAEVAIRKACVGKGRRWPAVVRTVPRSVRGPGRGWVVRLWGSRSFSRGSGGRQAWLGFRGLPIVQVCTGRGFWRFWGSLVWWQYGQRI